MTRRVLVVDDEDDIREVAQLSLELGAGWEVVAASSGEEALAIASTDPPPDAILLDVMMPEMDGPTTFRALQGFDATREIPVVLLTAKVQPADQRALAQLGVRGVLSKPFDPLMLPRQIAQLLGWEAPDA